MSRFLACSSLLAASVLVFASGGQAADPKPAAPASPASMPATPAATPPATTPAAAPPAATPPAATAPVGKRTFAIDTKKSSIVIQVFKDGAAAALAHDHVVDVRDFSGSIVADAADPASATVEVTAKTASFFNDETKLRKKFGLDGEMSDKDRKSVEDNMKSAEQLDVAGFPTVKFVSSSVSKDGARLKLNGKVTLHGVTKDVSMPLEAKVDGDTVTGTATFRLKTSDYGIKPYSALLGAVKNKDEIVLHLHLVGNAT